MSASDSDDEPLSVLAAAKRLNPENFTQLPEGLEIEPVKKKKKSLPNKKITMTIKLHKKGFIPPSLEPSMNVWLYIKDLNPIGPYSCLLCPEWFINRPRLVVHYILNHKKDFCGICRCFVPDRETWLEHQNFHLPLPCSQCDASFEIDIDLRQHFSAMHGLVHCRLCHFRMPDDEQYRSHLFQKHNVTNDSFKDEEDLWSVEYEGSPTFLCLLCSKSDNESLTFFNHYMGYHHFTLKCFSYFVSGKDPPFVVPGAKVGPNFVEEKLKDCPKIGYVDLEKSLMRSNISLHKIDDAPQENAAPNFEMKEEVTEDSEENTFVKTEEHIPKSDTNNSVDVLKKRGLEDYRTYRGDEDIDFTLTELIVLQNCYTEYLNNTIHDIKSRKMPEDSKVLYLKKEREINVACFLCNTNFNSNTLFSSHMSKMHGLKNVPVFSCRVCATTFESLYEINNHIKNETVLEFDDLWLCQFCDNEFHDREGARAHLTEHWDEIEYDNCFSPHLGFKCRYCPTLFWNEADRELHHTKVHLMNHKEQFYKCDICFEIYSDKVWFTHHCMDKHERYPENISYLIKCCLCCIVLSSVDEMRIHFGNEHCEATKIYCSLDMCQYKPLSQIKSFKLHLKAVHSPEALAERTSCTICGKDFPSMKACTAHMTHVHGPGRFKCKLCEEVLRTPDERKLHYMLRHPNQHPFVCKECGKSFQYKSSLYIHKKEHSTTKQTFVCSYCKKIFMKKDSYREHIQIHEGPRHACSYCPMRFVQRSNMLRHERRHTGERPYACQHCPRTFSDKGAANSHMRTHVRTDPFVCLYCGQKFAQKTKLTYHIRKHTGENLETCSVCQKNFTSGCALREHMKCHTPDSAVPNICPLCDRTYKNERSLLRHLRVGHNGETHECPICQKQLTSYIGLRDHVLTHSKILIFQCKICAKSYAVKRTMMRHFRKRHGLKGNEINITDYYKRYDPRECELGLDEEVLTTIFGPPKPQSKEEGSSNLVAAPANRKKKPIVNTSKDSGDDGDENDEDTGDESDGSKEDKSNLDETPLEFVKIKQEILDGDEAADLEPTDFVTVKIEPVDENDEC